ncbi:MAG: DUF1015 domain-containing protein [Eubacteriales bacterium]
MNQEVFLSADILIPKEEIDMTKWSVVACDQYTSEREYWEKIETIVGDEFSTLKMVFPEAYLEEGDFHERIEGIGKHMNLALEKDIFHTYKNSFIYVKRVLANGQIRHGIVGKIDLESYNYQAGSKTSVRATEGTIIERIPPRVKVRNNCPMELPHVMLLIDDESRNIIEKIAINADSLRKVYDFDLVQNSGSISGYLLNEECVDILNEGISQLANREAFQERYDTKEEDVLLFAAGDGNHSLATAKKCYENLKEEVGLGALKSKARYALVEVVNLHDESLVFEPIHRVMFQVDVPHLCESLCKQFQISETNDLNDHDFVMVTKDGKKGFRIKDAISNLAVGDLQKFLDDYMKNHGGIIDYIHGDDVVISLCADNKNAVGFLLNCMEKTELFKTVIVDGALPRKTFSMGEACDKRFYLEARTIV